MNQDNLEKLQSMLPPDDVVIDVGGGMAPFPRADWVIDAVPYGQGGKLLKQDQHPQSVRFSEQTWVQFDLCSRERWPFADKQFDFAVCSHVLEDVRDPVWVCSEMCRIAKAGYIEVPSRYVEQSLGIEHPRFAGYYHHRWLVSVEDGVLEFRHKPHLLHVTASAIVATLGFWRTINPRFEIETLFWEDDFEFREILQFDEQAVRQELADWCQKARQMPELLVYPSEPWRRRLRRLIYFTRMRLGRVS